MAVTGTNEDPDVGSAPVSSGWGMVGLMVIDVALTVAHVSVVVCPLLKNIGLAVNCEIVGATACATCTVVVCGAVVPCPPVAVAV